ncbi:cytochrome c oxidase subunit 3 [Jiulongibacter sp. NS-SX5]|uniref:cytochrome c oxidase subunit 3 n=1 Tax=Jiulongibacter sp. NS-SX5 TaxID=3463854 RepID=UPI0040580088
MTAENNLSENVKPVLSINKWKFITWLFIITIVMLFASQTSAYLVRRAEGNWTEFEMPPIFYWSTLVLLVSSVFMFLAQRAARADAFSKLKMFITITFGFGIAFLVMQYIGWQELQETGIYLKGNPSGSFLYILTGLHGFHLITGLVVLITSLIAAFKMNIHSKSLVKIEVCSTYWHFLDILWIYLFVFLLYFR